MVTGTTANTLSIGTSSLPCKDGYTQTAFTVTSARSAKTSIRDFTAEEIAVAKDIVRTCPRIYQLVTSVAEKGAGAARLHSGCIYEEVYQCFIDGGLDPELYSIFCATTRDDTDENGTEIVDKGLRYEELMIWYAVGLMRLYSDLDSRISALESQNRLLS